jgi:hypothetical protein
MVHPQHVKPPKLQALLIGKRTVPSGCKVLNVSQQGMSLQCNPDGRLLTFSNGDNADIYLSVQHVNGHNKFTIPAIVSHVNDSTIDVVFHCTDPELAGLIESYRTSNSHNIEASIDHRQASREESALQPAAMNESVSHNTQADRTNSQSSRSFYSGLFTLLITSLALLGAYYYVSSTNNRLNTLETVNRSHANKLAEVQTQAFSSRFQDGRFPSLNAGMRALTNAFHSVENYITQTLSQNPVIIATATTAQVKEPPVAPRDNQKPATGVPKPQAAKEAPVVMAEKQTIEESSTPSPQKYLAIETRPAAPVAIKLSQSAPQAALSTTSWNKPHETGTAVKQKPLPAPKPVATPVVQAVATPTRTAEPVIDRTGPWVINLLSSTDKAYIDKAMADAQSKGFNLVVKSATVKGRQYWRLQAPGFVSMAEAKTAAEPIKEQLKIKNIWIFKR